MGGLVATIDVFNNPAALNNIVLGVIGRQYSYDPVHGQRRRIHDGANTTAVPLADRPHVRLDQRLRLRDRLQRRHVHRQRHSDVPLLGVDHRAPATHALMTAPQMFTLGGNFYTFDQDRDRRVRQRHRQPADVSDQSLPVLAQRRDLHHQHQRSAEHGDRRRQRLPDDRRQHAVRDQRRAVHDRAQGRFAQRRDHLRPVQHHAGQRRRDRELRLSDRHAERTDRRQRHRPIR